MAKSVAIVGAGVSGLTCGVVFAERGFRAAIFAEQIGQQTTSGAAAALWFPYDAEPADRVIPWALATYKLLVDLIKNPLSGVSMIELRQYCRTGEIQIPDWAKPFVISTEVEKSLTVFSSGFALRVPLMDTTIYLDYLASRFQKAGGAINTNVRFEKLEDVDPKFDLVVNCAGIGARELVHDADLEPHRGQVAIVSKIDKMKCAIVCDDDPLMYAIPRTNDCVVGGTNDVSDNLNPDSMTTKAIVAECARVLEIESPRVLRERVGLRPFRKSGVRLEKEKLSDGRTVIHNYGHGGSGFTLSWGSAENVFSFLRRQSERSE
ncbi:MAG TPA: FAD-dependent oxidoreductase [Chthoniobacterales bacterium]|nr:FAD-dependent oxidoreductase [Chthoniobacterales bacterium]